MTMKMYWYDHYKSWFENFFITRYMGIISFCVALDALNSLYVWCIIMHLCFIFYLLFICFGLIFNILSLCIDLYTYIWI